VAVTRVGPDKNLTFTDEPEGVSPYKLLGRLLKFLPKQMPQK